MSESELASFNARLRRALLEFGSETPDNLALAKGLAYRVEEDRADGAPTKQGPTVSAGLPLLSELFWPLEGEPIPSAVAEAHPDLSQERWDDACRMIELILLALEWGAGDEPA